MDTFQRGVLKELSSGLDLTGMVSTKSREEKEPVEELKKKILAFSRQFHYIGPGATGK